MVIYPKEPDQSDLKFNSKFVLALSIAAVLAGMQVSVAQADESTIHLKSRSFIPESGVEPQAASALDENAVPGSHQVLIVQFNQIPDEAQRRELEKAGIKLLEYIPDNTWLVSMRPEPVQAQAQALSQQTLSNVRWLGTLSTLDKMESSLAKGEFGDWAKNTDDGTVTLWVDFFKGVPLNEARKLVISHGGTVAKEIPELSRLVISLPEDRDMVLAFAGENSVQWIMQEPPPPQPVNDDMRINIKANPVQASPANLSSYGTPYPFYYGLSGNGVNAAIWDGGHVADTHADFLGRLILGDAGTTNDHATHVAGTMAGDGANSSGELRGVAPDAKILSYYWDNNITDHNDAINNRNGDLSQNSWGTKILPPFFGSCSDFGNYVGNSADYDNIMTGLYGRKIPVVFAAGNSRDDSICGMNGGPFYINYGNILPGGQTAKNTITVGAINSDDSNMTDFSSWGPTDDGRIKPEVVAPGDETAGESAIRSTLPGGGYGLMSGTSMAAPVVSGSIALMLERYRQMCPTSGAANGGRPLPSTYKALLIHTARDLFNVGPDYMSGYGAIDVKAAIEMIPLHVEGSVDNGGVNEYQIAISRQNEPLKVTLVWDDKPAAANAGITRVNNLDLELEDPTGTIHYPWVLDSNNPSNPATTGVDNINVVEQVSVEIQPNMPGVWIIRVKGSSVPQGPQSYSLVTKHLAESSCQGLNADVWAPNWSRNAIFMRTDDDDGHINLAHQGYQNPEYGQVNYAYSRVHNRGTDTAYNVRVFHYIADFAAGISPPPGRYWNLIGTSVIAEIPPGGSRIIEPIPWEPIGTGHKCALIRIISPSDPTFNFANQPNGWRWWGNTINNDSLSQINMSVVDLKADPVVEVNFTLRNVTEQQALVNMVMQATDGKGQVIPLGNGKVSVKIPPAMLPRIQGPVAGLGDVKETLSGGLSAEIDSTSTDSSTIGGISMAPGEEFEVGMVFQAPNLPEGETLENYYFDVLNQVDGETVGRVTFMVLPQGTNEPESSTLYGVQDEGKNDSQFFRIDSDSNETIPLGSVYEGYDIEALAKHPETGEFYAASGDDGNNPGHLYKFTQTNGLTIIGDTEFAEIDSLSFNPNDAILWGWATGKGLITIDIISGKGTLKVPYKGFIGDIAWNKQGNLLYVVDGAKLWIYDKDSGAVTQSNCTLPQGKTEALEMLSNDKLMFGTHGGTTIRVMNLNSCKVVEEEEITTPFNDIEGIVSVDK